MNLIYVYRICHLKTAEYTFFSSAHGTFSRTDHILVHKENPGKLKKIKNHVKCILWSHGYEIRNHLPGKKQEETQTQGN